MPIRLAASFDVSGISIHTDVDSEMAERAFPIITLRVFSQIVSITISEDIIKRRQVQPQRVERSTTTKYTEPRT